MPEALATHTEPPPILELSGVSKRFPGVQALDDMRLVVRAGEVHAVIGENGAGKSTLMHILAGVHQPDGGRISFGGNDIRIADEQAAQQLGIAIVYQERSLFGSLNVAENIFAGRQPVRWGNWIDRRRMDTETGKLLERLQLPVHPRALVGELSPAEQQLVEIAKALSLSPRLIIFDEPTAALTERETQTLFRAIRELRAAGTAIIYISHRLEEVFAICDCVTVLKDGRWQMTTPIGAATPHMLVRAMVGRELPPVVRKPTIPSAAAPALEVKSLYDDLTKARHGTRLRDVSLKVRGGEIVALAGLSGAGRTETALTVFGARAVAAGQIVLSGRPTKIRNVADAIAAGIGYLPEDRKQAGLFLEMTIAQNMAAANMPRFGRMVTSNRAVYEAADAYRRRLNIACYDVSQAVRTLSGGNQQKVLLAKWLLVEPRVLLVDEPTRGVDVGAKFEVHRLLVELAGRGTAVVLISSDLTEVLSVSDRIIVMTQGRVAGELSRAEATEERIIHLASSGAAA